MANDMTLNQIVRDIKKKYKLAVKEVAEKVGWEIEEAYESAIERFYEDYPDPIFYDRTYYLYYGSSAFKSVSEDAVMQLGDMMYASGINVSPVFYPSDWYVQNLSYVFNRAFYKGIHGITRADAIKRNRKLSSGEKGKIKHIPKKMYPPPVYFMNQEFKRIKKSGNLDKIVADAYKKVGLDAYFE